MASVFDDLPVLAERQNVRASALNGGTRRILSIGLACCGLLRGLLILDEPTNDLGRELAADVGQAIRRLAERDQNAVIVVSHDFQWLKTTADPKRLFTLRNKQRVVQASTPNHANSAARIQALPRNLKASNNSALTVTPTPEIESTESESSDPIRVIQSQSTPAQVAASDEMPRNATTRQATYASDFVLSDFDSSSASGCMALIDMECFPLLPTSSDEIHPDYVGEMI